MPENELDIKVVRSISFPLSLYNLIDKLRGDVSRSRYIEGFFRLGWQASGKGMKLDPEVKQNESR